MSGPFGGPAGERLPGPEGVAPPAPEAPEETAPEAPEETAPEAPEETAPEAPEETVLEDVFADLDELAVARRERDDYLDALRRVQADFENYKKRMAKQQAEQAERARAGLIEALLPVLDIADLAASHGAGDDVTQVRGALLDALGREGLERIDPVGEPFDPNVADAVAHEPGDGTQEVAEVLRAGYRWKSRVLRPAMVKVRG